MKYTKLILSLFVCIVIINFMAVSINADERNIYIGDLITLEISSPNTQNMEEEIKKAFSEFEIVELKKNQKGYLITIRSFEPGEKKVNIGNKEIIINVYSTLKDINRKDIFEGDLTPKSYGNKINFLYVYIGVLIIFIISAAILIIRKLKKNKIKKLSPYEKFTSSLKQIDLSNNTCLLQMTIVLKKYIESIYDIKIIGKTSEEIIAEINTITQLKPFVVVINNWFKECNYYKFSGDSIDEEQKKKLLMDLMKIGLSIHENSEVNI